MHTIQLAAAGLAALTLVYALTGGYRLVERYLLEIVPTAECGSSFTSWTSLGICQKVTIISLVSVMGGYYLGFTDPFLTASIPLIGLLSLSAYVDAKVRKLPNKLTFYSFLSLLFGVGLRFIILPLEQPLGFVFSSLLGALVWVLPLALIYFLLKGIGFGDVKLAPVLGGWLGLYGFETAYLGMSLAFLLGGAWALFLVIGKQKSMKTRIAFGPFLICGAFLAWVFAV